LILSIVPDNVIGFTNNKNIKDEIKKLYHQIFSTKYREKFKLLDKKYTKFQSRICYCVKYNECIGFILYYIRNNQYKSLHIDYLGVSEKYKGIGIGKLLLNTIMNSYKSYQITLECENHLLEYYNKFGFKLYKNIQSNNLWWNLLYINNYPQYYNSFYNELYNNKYSYKYNKLHIKLFIKRLQIKVIYLQNNIFIIK